LSVGSVVAGGGCSGGHGGFEVGAAVSGEVDSVDFDLSAGAVDADVFKFFGEAFGGEVAVGVFVGVDQTCHTPARSAEVISRGSARLSVLR
jgi:hypothetical protein